DGPPHVRQGRGTYLLGSGSLASQGLQRGHRGPDRLRDQAHRHRLRHPSPAPPRDQPGEAPRPRPRPPRARDAGWRGDQPHPHRATLPGGAGPGLELERRDPAGRAMNRASLAGLILGDGRDVAVMGALNLSPDSFYAGSVTTSRDALIAAADEMVAQGAAILDVGAMSTAPYLDGEIEPAREADRLGDPVQLRGGKLG